MNLWLDDVRDPSMNEDRLHPVSSRLLRATVEYWELELSKIEAELAEAAAPTNLSKRLAYHTILEARAIGIRHQIAYIRSILSQSKTNEHAG